MAHIQFIDCASLNISFDKMGYATASFTLVCTTLDFEVPTEIAGVVGHPIFIRAEPLPEIPEVYNVHITLKGVKNG